MTRTNLSAEVAARVAVGKHPEGDVRSVIRLIKRERKRELRSAQQPRTTREESAA
jgi:hypothetical protein